MSVPNGDFIYYGPETAALEIGQDGKVQRVIPRAITVEKGSATPMGDGFDEYRGFDQDLRDAYADGYVDALDAVSSAVEHEDKCQSRLFAHPVRECNCYRHDVVTAIARLREGRK